MAEIEQKHSILRDALEYVAELVRVVVISLAIILPVRYFLVQPFYVKGASMEPNFYDHEYLIIDELSYRLRDPQRGEIVVFRYPEDPRQFFIKRVVALPGETVKIEGGRVHVKKTGDKDQILIQEKYLSDAFVTSGGHERALGADEYFLLGDNRKSSLDSRSFGPVNRRYIVGRAWLRGWPLDRVARFITPHYTFDTSKE